MVIRGWIGQMRAKSLGRLSREFAEASPRLLLPDALRWGGGLLVVAMTVLRCLTLFGDQIVFDVDPVIDPHPLAGLGPPGSLWISVLLLLGAAAALVGEALSGRRIERWPLLLVFIPVPLLMWQAAQHIGNLWEGTTWLAGIVAAVTLLHLGRDRRFRIVLIALLAAVLAPLLVRGAANATFEYHETIRHYEMSKQQILSEKGWAEDSPNTLIFERRMTMSTNLLGLDLGQPTAWFVTTNIFGSFMGFGLIAMTGLALGAFFARMQSGWPALLALIAIACAVGLYLTQSKGALLSTLGGLVLLAPVAGAGFRGGRLRMTRGWRMLSRATPFIAVGAIILAIIGVLLRGTVLPESFAGEKSLLYRWHYTIASAEIFFEHPLAGVGPEGFQEAYTKHRPPRNPEEVASAHNVLWDWLVSFGIWGLGWIALFFTLLWRSGAGVGRMMQRSAHLAPAAMKERADQDHPVAWRNLHFFAPVSVAVCALLPAILIEAHALAPLDVMIRALGIAGYVGCAIALMIVLDRMEELLAMLTLFAAAVALGVHSQIETTFVLQGSAVWALSILGVAGSLGRSSGPPGNETESDVEALRGYRWAGFTAGAAVALMALWFAATGAIPATRQQGYMLQAAAELRPIANARLALQVLAHERDLELREEAADRFLRSLRSAGVDAGALRQAGVGGRFDPRQMTQVQWERLQPLLREAELRQRLATEPILLKAHNALPTTAGPLVYLAKQLDWAQQVEWNMERRIEILRRAAGYLEHWIERGGGGGTHQRASYIYFTLAMLTGDAVYQQRTIEIAGEMVERDPNGVQSWRRLGDILWEFGQRDRAAEAYREALKRNRNFALDPLKQLPEREVEMMRQRLSETEEGEGEGGSGA